MMSNKKTTVGTINSDVAYTAGREELDRSLAAVDCIGTAAHNDVVSDPVTRP